MSDGSETDNRRLLERIKNVLPKLNKEGKRKGASEKRCMITLYAASSLTNLKYKGYINKRDGFRYFSISTLRDIAKNEEKILGPDVDIPFDTDTAKKIFKILEQQDGYVKFLSKKNISKDICRGDTSPITITKKGENYCRRLIDELIDEQRLIQYASTSDKVHDDLTQVQQNYGLNWLSPGFFESHRCTENDFDD